MSKLNQAKDVSRTLDAAGGPASAANAKPKAPKTTLKSRRSKPNKSQTVIAMLQRKRGATLAELVKVTGWQQHSVRGLISGTIKKKLQLNVATEAGGKCGTRYRIVPGQEAE